MTASSRTAALPVRTDVLIVGAGPAGLTLAASLRLLGVDHVLNSEREVLERWTPFARSRALCLP